MLGISKCVFVHEVHYVMSNVASSLGKIGKVSDTLDFERRKRRG